MKHIYGERIHHLMVQVWHGPPIIILHMRTKWGVIIDLSCTPAHSHDTIAAALFRDENTFRQNSPEAFLMHHHFEVTEMTLQEALWSKVKLSLISAPTNDLLTCKGEKGGGWGGGTREGKGQTKDRAGRTHSQHIFSSLPVGGREPIIQLLAAVTG